VKNQQNQPAAPALAYSYIRFSKVEQADGDSLRRQTKNALDWCDRNGATLDTSTTHHDLGKSAFLGEHRKNPDRYALAAYLKLVEGGKVPRGSFLLVESLDRLTREHIRPALTLMLNLIESGIRVVQLSPVEVIYDDRVEPMQLMMMIMELSRGHSESAVKSERVGAAWADKKERARKGTHIVTHLLPAWVREKNGKLELIPEAAKAVSRIFELARTGYGHAAITRKLTEEQVPAIGRTASWSKGYVCKILKGRAVLGEYEPCKRDGTPDGEPIPNYYPRVISDADWHDARTAMAARKDGPAGGRKRAMNASTNNLFAGMATDARNGGGMHAVQRVSGRKHWIITSTEAAQGRASAASFPLTVLERAILSKLRELDPRDLMDTRPPNESATLEAELTAVEESIVSIGAEMDANGESPALYRRLRVKEARQKELTEALAVAKAAEATPVAAAWSEYHSLVDVMDAATDREDMRRRLRAALRRIVDGIWILVVPRGMTRIAAVRVQFRGTSAHREYLIVYRAPKSNGVSHVPAKTEVRAFAEEINTLDLRNLDHVRDLEKQLLKLKLEL
jgi:DNA invertase Pin-like site-specific DNA recombinase